MKISKETMQKILRFIITLLTALGTFFGLQACGECTDCLASGPPLCT